MKTKLFHRTGIVAILFLVLLLLAQGASATTILKDSDGMLNISGNRTFPVSMFQICDYYHDDLESCTNSLTKLSNFTASDYTMKGTGPLEDYWNTTFPYFASAGKYYSSYSSGYNYGGHQNEPYFYGYSQYKEEPMYAENYTTLYNRYNNIKALDTNHPVFLYSINYFISGATYNASQVTDVLYQGVYPFRDNTVAGGTCSSYPDGQYRRPTTDPCAILYYYTDDSIFAGEYALISNFLTPAGVASIEGLPNNLAMYNTIQAINETLTADASMRALSPEKLRAYAYWSVTAGFQGLSFWGYKFYGGGTCDGCLYENATQTTYYNNFAGELTSPEIQDVLLLPTVNYSWNYYDTWDEKVNFSANPTRTINYTWAQTYKTGYALTYRLKYNTTSNKYYLIVANKLNVSVSPTITISGLTGTQTATTMGITGTGSSAPGQESTVTDGVFTDTFDAYAAHIYEISNATTEGESSNATTWTISGSGGDATWSENSTSDNVTEDIGSHYVKVGRWADDFEDNNEDWTVLSGKNAMDISTAQAIGTYSFRMNAANEVEYYNYSTNLSSIVTPNSVILKVYDNGTGNANTWFTQAANTSSISYYIGVDTTGIGICPDANSTYFCYRMGSSKYVSSVPRLTAAGWVTIRHEFNGTHVNGYINEIQIFSNSSSFGLFQIMVGNAWAASGLAYFDDVRVTQTTSGNLTTWHNWTDGNVTYQIVVNVTTPANTNYSIYGGQNGTALQLIASENQTGNQTIGVASDKFENYDVMIQLYGNETATPELMSITYYSQAPVTYAPNITSWGNTKTNNNTANLTVNASESVTFNATANQSIVTWNWYVNGSNQNNNHNNISLSYASEGTRLVQVNATNSNGTSNSISWNMTVLSSSTVWTTGIGGQFFQNKTIGSNNSCINQGDGAISVNCESVGTDNFNDNNKVGWNTSQVSGSTTFTLANGSLNISGGGTVYLNQNTTNYTNKAMFLEVTHYNNLMSYVEIDLMGNLSRGTPQKMVQFSTAAGTNRTHIYTGDSWTVVNNTKSMPMFVEEKQYLIFMSNGSNPIYYRGHISNISFSDALTNSLISGYNNTWLNGSTVQFGGSFNASAIVKIDNVRTVNLSLLGEQVLQGNYSMNYTVPASQYAKNITVNGSYPSGTNYSVKYRQNATGNYISVEGVKTADAVIELPTPYFQSIDIMLEMNASTSDTLWINTISVGTSQTAGDGINNTPTISFVDPTPANNSVNTTRSVFINTTSYDADNDNMTALLNWNNSLVGWWRMNEAAGGTLVQDFSGYGNNGTWYGNTTSNVTTGRFGNALAFDGVNDYVQINQNTFDGLTNLTTSSWVNFNSLTGLEALQTIISALKLGVGHYWSVTKDDDNNISINSGACAATVATTISVDKWYHIAITKEAGVFRIFLNGVLIKESSTGCTGAIGVNTGVTAIGAQATLPFRELNGSIDEVRIYNRALSAEEINASYNAGTYRLQANFTNLPNGIYNYTAYVQDSTGAVNQTETRYLTVDPPYTPPVPVISSVMTGNFYVNTTWTAGSGNKTDSYNSTNGTTWINSTLPYRNTTLSPHARQNLTIYAYNSSYTGTLSLTALTNNTQIPNNIPEMDLIGNKEVTEGQWLNFSITGTDADSDSLSCSSNNTKGTIASCNFNWSTGPADIGTYNWIFYLNDSYGGSDSETITITVNADLTPPASITGLTNSTGNFNHNWTWTNPSDSDFSHTMIYINGAFAANISSMYYNLTASVRDQSTISTRTVDTYGNINTTWVNHTSIIANNAISISGISDTYNINAGNTLNIDADYSDADGDTGTFARNFSTGTFSTTTGVLSWATGVGDVGTYNWQINVSDGYGSVATKEFTVTVSASGGSGTDWDWATFNVYTINGTGINNAMISTSVGNFYTNEYGTVNTGYMFEHGLTYWINVSKSGYQSNNTQLTFNEDHENYTIYLTESAPVLSIINNSKTNDAATTKIFLDNAESITFFASSNHPITTWNWSVDSVIQSNNYDNLTTSWSTGKYHYVSLSGVNTYGTSNTLTWGVNVFPAMATATIGALNETPADAIRDALKDKDAPALVMATVLPFTNLLGAFFYAIVWFMVFVMLWIKQKSMNVPMIIGIIFGGLIISFLPEQYQLVTTALIVLGIFGIIYIFFKGRG